MGSHHGVERQIEDGHRWESTRRWGHALRTPIFPMHQFETTDSIEPEHTGTQVSAVSRTGLVSALRFLEGLFVTMGDKEVEGNLARVKGILATK